MSDRDALATNDQSEANAVPGGAVAPVSEHVGGLCHLEAYSILTEPRRKGNTLDRLHSNVGGIPIPLRCQ